MRDPTISTESIVPDRPSPDALMWRRYRQWSEGPEISYTSVSALLQDAYMAGWTDYNRAANRPVRATEGRDD